MNLSIQQRATPQQKTTTTQQHTTTKQQNTNDTRTHTRKTKNKHNDSVYTTTNLNLKKQEHTSTIPTKKTHKQTNIKPILKKQANINNTYSFNKKQNTTTQTKTYNTLGGNKITNTNKQIQHNQNKPTNHKHTNTTTTITQ